MALIIGIDLGKHKSVSCSYDTDTRAATYVTLATEPAAMRRLLESSRPGLVAFEAGTPAGWLADLCREMGLDHLVASPKAEAWAWREVNRTTDRDIALPETARVTVPASPKLCVPRAGRLRRPDEGDPPEERRAASEE